VPKKGNLIITITKAPGNRTRGILRIGSRAFPVALGRAGIKANKREGDGATPRGIFRPVRLWWRADRLSRPTTLLPLRSIKWTDAWCEDPANSRYNKPMVLRSSTAGDRLWREDHLYDLIIEINHNTRPCIARRGSAVFLHLSRNGLLPTAGCIAMPMDILKRIVSHLTNTSTITIL
jgi:L,D-peptidoglycan transpeptidase YkuD (ErfK/YbiS/YcfS/YnhG family)